MGCNCGKRSERRLKQLADRQALAERQQAEKEAAAAEKAKLAAVK